MSLVYITGWPPIGAIIHVGLQLGKHILMLVHCLRGLPNFNQACLWLFRAWKNTCHLHQSYHPAYHSPASFSHTHWHPHRKKAMGHRLVSIKPTLVLCFVLAELTYHWTGTMLGQRKTVVGRIWQSNALSNPLIYCVLCFSPKHTRGVQPILGQRRRRWANIDLILFPEFSN